MVDINCLLAHLYRAAWLETKLQAGAKSLILNPGQFVVQTISWLQEPNQILLSPIKGAKLPRGSVTVALCAILHGGQDRSECLYSPIVLTNTRFRP